MKKHSLDEHFADIARWRSEHELFVYPGTQDHQLIWFTAYDRWLNDRELFSVEDGYEWKWHTVVPEK